MSQVFDAALAGAPALSGASQSHAGFRIGIERDLHRLQPHWDALRAASGASAYQSFAFQSAWAEHAEQINGSQSCAVTIADAEGRIGALMPLSISRSGPLHLARNPGGKHVNFNMPLALPGFLPADPTTLRDLMRRVGRSAGVDVFSFANQPEQWHGRPHAFLPLGGQPSPSFAYKLSLFQPCDDLIKSRMSQDARNKLRRKQNRLAELGTLRFAEAASTSEAEAVLAAFLAQKASRMAAMGLPNPFIEPGIAAFLRQACFDGVETGASAIRLFGLWLNDRVIATYGAAVDGNRFSGMFTSFDNSEDLFRWSPGEHMLLWLIQEHCRKGLSVFDLGVGEARYKSQFCDEEERLFDLHLAVTAKGEAATALLRAASGAKRRLKQNERFMGWLAAARKASRHWRG